MSRNLQLSLNDLSVEAVNAARQPTLRLARRRARRRVRTVELTLAARHADALSGRVLEIGSRGDGLTVLLADTAAAFTGVCLSSAEATVCRQRRPESTFVEANLTDLDALIDEPVDAIVAGRGGLDGLTDALRRDALAGLHGLLADDGVLILTSHNLACESRVNPPVRDLCRAPWRVLGLPDALANRARLGRLQQREAGWAILNDGTDGFGRLAYYVSRDHQERQFAELDFGLIECLDCRGRPVARGTDGYPSRDLHYVARRL